MTTTVSKHQAQIDEPVLSELKRLAEEANLLKGEVAATMRGSDSGDDAPLLPAFQLKRGAKAQAEQDKKVPPHCKDLVLCV